MTDHRYPIGKFDAPATIDFATRSRWIEDIAATPANLRKAVQGLTASQLDTPYREGGWTVRQVVHHVPDSHMNAYVRFKLAVTEENPTIRPYEEGLWAELADGKGEDIETSLVLLESLHRRWVTFLRSLTEAQFERTLVHPESGKHSLAKMCGLYSWHGRHHVAHITSLRERMKW